jgi:outer membrane lipoprotein SlyB
LLRMVKFNLLAMMLATLLSCAPDYSPNVYSGNAVQQANKVERGTVVGFRQVEIRANGTVGAVSGGAAGGVLGAQTEGSGIVSALGAVAGTVVGGVVGTTIEHTTGDTTGWEYIVRKLDGELMSVTQREAAPIPLGQRVLVITGTQARVIGDYSTAIEPPPAPSHGENKADAKTAKDTKDVPAATQPFAETPRTSAPAGEPATPGKPNSATSAAPSPVPAAPETPATSASEP